MKKTLLVAMMVILLGLGFAQSPVSAAGGGGGPTTTVVDGEQAGHAFAMDGDWTLATGQMSFVRKYPSGVTKNIVVDVTAMRQNKVITFPRIVWDGVAIVGPTDTPATSIPSDAYGEMTQVNFNLWVMHNGGWINGYFWSPSLAPEAPIVMNMTPGWRQQLIVIPTEMDQTGMRLWLSNMNGYVYFDPNSGGYMGWFDSMNGDPVTWQLQLVTVNDDGTVTVTVIANGTVVWGGQPTTPTGSAMTLRNAGGVAEGWLEGDGTGNGSCYLDGQPFGSWVQRQVNGQPTWQQAAVIVSSANGQSFYLSANGFHGTIEVRDPNQNMKLIATVSTGDGTDYASLGLNGLYEYHEIVITILGVPEEWGMSVYLNGMMAQPTTPTDGGGEKG